MLAQQFLNGVLLGATYALFALGFTLMFGVLRVINLTYGFYFSAGAFIALFLTRQAGFGIWTALPLAAFGAGGVAVVLDWLLLSRLRRVQAPELASLMVTLGAVLALYAGATAILGPDIRRLPPELVASDAWVVAGLRITTAQIADSRRDGGAGRRADRADPRHQAGTRDPRHGGAAGYRRADGHRHRRGWRHWSRSSPAPWPVPAAC